jgi:enamine deaminase RidA (YjgF/YER057c/UK114 family)
MAGHSRGSSGTTDPEQRLAELGLVLPPPPKPVASYLPAVESGALLFVSGMLPFAQGEVLYPGRLGEGVTVEQGVAAARQAVLNGLSVVAEAAGSLNRVTRVVRINGYVASTPDFHQQPAVMNGASDLLAAVFGSLGRHSRAAVGVAALPLNASVEVDLIVELARRPSRQTRIRSTPSRARLRSSRSGQASRSRR